MVKIDMPIIGGYSNLEELLESEDQEISINKPNDWYFAPKSFERDGRLYEKIGIKPFKRFVIATFGRIHRFFEKDKTGSNYFIGQNRNLEALKKFESETRFNEIVHAPLTVFSGYKIIDHLSNNSYIGATFWGAMFLSQFYPTILQRYNRARIYNTLDKLAEDNCESAPINY